MKHIEGISRNQVMMTDLESLIPANSECRVIDIFCDKLDMVKLGFVYAETKDEGRPPYDPTPLLKLYLYGLLNRICSSGKLSLETTRNIEVIWLINGMRPSKRTLCYFKENNKEQLRKVFVEFNQFYKKIGLFGKQTVALDSVKVKENNSKKRNHNQKTIDRTLKKTQERIDEYLDALDEADKNDGFNEERELTSDQIKEIIEKLSAKKEKFENLHNELEKCGETQISETDPDSRCMKQGSGKGMDVSYNTQVVTEAESKMIVDYKTTNNGSDKGQLTEMGKSAKEFLEADKLTMLADTGYHDGKDMLEAEKNDVTCLVPKGKDGNQKAEEGYKRKDFTYDVEKDEYTCPEGHTLKHMRDQTDSNGDTSFVYANYSACSNCPNREKCTKRKHREIARKSFQTAVDELDKRFIKRKDEYKKRQEIIEHQFGTIKWVWGFDRYYTKGIEFAAAENALRFTAYNLRRAINMMGVEGLIEAIKACLSAASRQIYTVILKLFILAYAKLVFAQSELSMANSRLNSNSAFVSPITVPAKPLCKTPEINLLANAADENERNGFHNDRADGRVGVDKGKLRSAGGKNISITKAYRERRRQCRKSENDVPYERFLLRDFPFSN